ncbi:glycosyltransferase [Streptomyces sp. AA4]|uniref:UDP-N-acetylglucosamine--N-acetylmuramyl- (pentapeptide) pyrophosphoryl-undecaprenol N-acetylglucosamine transferase n=1 Tax=Actinomycetes TaxID=1760 RepID=UPI0001B55C36|nr:UDP-N-acetylglucosamine--N-acetylmuramyl-(pentapeptide) pyrophosphoryl-undecaprenol N-acetylglucosamine transferase [Streptomyces sp. AA4]
MIVTGGGTGGHTYPALTAVRALRSRIEADDRALDVLWIGKDGGLEQRVAESAGFRFAAVATGKIRRASNPLKMITAANLKDMGRVPLGIAQARSLVAGFRPHVVLATGGYVAVPVGLAARICGRPLVVHEQTVRLGLTNKLLARAATCVAVSSESTLELLPSGVRAVVTGNPVRPELLHGSADRAVEAPGLRGFAPDLPTVYVTGGAQGSRQINQLVCRSAPWLLEQANLVHQCGKGNAAQLQSEYARQPAELVARCFVTEFVGDELADVLALSDLVVARSGAGTIAELTALGKPSVLIPLASSAGNEQLHNARNLHDAGAAVALTGAVSEDALRAAMTPLLTERDRRLTMAARARKLGRPDAAQRLVDAMLEAAARR